MKRRLARLRSRLAGLRRRRRLARLTVGLSALAVALLWALIGTFLGDWLFDMSRPQRLLTVLACAGVVVWAFHRFTRPWLGWHESLIDMALLVQRQEEIDSDLVAALQFESPEAPQWGSVELEQAVIEQAAQLGRRVRPALDVSSTQVFRRTSALLATLALVTLSAWLFPDYLRAFFDRLLLRSVRYPTHTLIESLTINGAQIDPAASDREEIACPYGMPLRLEVICSGKLPDAASARLTTEKSRLQTDIPLDPQAGFGVYAGEWPRLVDDARLEVFAGDARTDPLRLVVVPPPAVDVQFEVTPPRYAATGTSPTETVSGLRQLSVVEGSRVVVQVHSDKPLKESMLTLEGVEHRMARAGEPPLAGQRELWAVDPASTPLAAVSEPLRYAIQVRDRDGLSLERPIEGVIRIKVDHPPEITATALTTLVLPAARPTLAFKSTDDYGIGEVAVLAEVMHPDGSPGEKTEVKLYALRAGEAPRKNVEDRQRFELAPLKAVKGDQVRVTLRATDDRGGPGKPALSEPLVFEVTDEQGIYAAMAEADRESARRLQTMIDSQIDVGAGK